MQFKVLLVSALAGVVVAYTQPQGASPQGNALSTPGLNELVPAGKSFKIEWKPTSEGTVTLILLRGPSENAVYQQTIVERIANSGSYTWNVPADLTPDKTHYGIELISDATGQYQYTTQFGVSAAPGYGSGSSSSSLPASFTDSLTFVTGEGTAHCGALNECPHTSTSAAGSASTLVASANTTTVAAKTTKTAKTAKTTLASTGGKPTSVVMPTGNMTVPATLSTTVAAAITSTSSAIVGVGATTTVAAGGSASAKPSSSSVGISTAGAAKMAGAGFGIAAFIAGFAAFL